METPELSSSKEIVVQDQIKSNQTEAQKAQEEYTKLQNRVIQRIQLTLD
jgi:hypothetical protein